VRDLEAANAVAKSTKHVFTVSLIIPLAMGFGAWALATGAAPALPLRDNYLEMLAFLIIGFTFLMLPIPYIFRWNWETKYFGAGLLAFGSGSIIGVYPILCIALYSTLPLLLRTVFVIFEGWLIVWWCLRFVRVYRLIYEDKSMFTYIYVEEEKEIYLLQQADKIIIKEKFKLDQVPGTRLTLFPMIISLAITPYAPLISEVSGIPFTHIFLAIGATPLNLLFLGLSTKAWLIFYYYASKIQKETGKAVYIDKSSPPPKLNSIKA
jgi:hypothetical protein